MLPVVLSDTAVRMLPRSRAPFLSKVTGSPSHNLERMSVNTADEELMTVVDVMDVTPINNYRSYSLQTRSVPPATRARGHLHSSLIPEEACVLPEEKQHHTGSVTMNMLLGR